MVINTQKCFCVSKGGISKAAEGIPEEFILSHTKREETENNVHGVCVCISYFPLVYNTSGSM